METSPGSPSLFFAICRLLASEKMVEARYALGSALTCIVGIHGLGLVGNCRQCACHCAWYTVGCGCHIILKVESERVHAAFTWDGQLACGDRGICQYIFSSLIEPYVCCRGYFISLNRSGGQCACCDVFADSECACRQGGGIARGCDEVE